MTHENVFIIIFETHSVNKTFPIRELSTINNINTLVTMYYNLLQIHTKKPKGFQSSHESADGMPLRSKKKTCSDKRFDRTKQNKANIGRVLFTLVTNEAKNGNRKITCKQNISKISEENV